ncbi:MAG: redox-regulated ATPase YchF, partial [Parcubacteria group bacterium]|nr:redox-regulated ATPase YchF [Parcubacteria group bacterium]
PFCTIDPSVGIVPVPDDRLSRLAALSNSAKVIPAVVEFTDIAGLVAGASKGEGLGNKFLQNIREVDAIAEVVRIFEDPDIVHTSGAVNPLRDIEVINLELILADYEVVSKRRASVEKEKRAGKKEAVALDAALQKLETAFDAGKLAQHAGLSEDELVLLQSLNLLTLKPILYCFNRKSDQPELPDELAKFVTDADAKWVSFDVALERGIAEFSETEKAIARQEFGISEEGLDLLIRKSYELLDLMTFFTTGPDETRGWTVKRGSSAPEAGRAIHTDFHDKFIRAEVVSSEDLLSAGSYAAAREKGLVRTEGKDYIVKDGDVIEFKI